MMEVQSALIVEKDPISSAAISRVFDGERVKILKADSAKATINILASIPINLIILDLSIEISSDHSDHSDHSDDITGGLLILSFLQIHALTTPGVIVLCPEQLDDSAAKLLLLHSSDSILRQPFCADTLRDCVIRHMKENVKKRADALRRNHDDFSHVVYHDLKQPLRAIDNLSLWIEEDTVTLPDVSKDHLSKLRNRVTLMAGMLDDLRKYSLAGERSCPIETIHLQTLVTTLVTAMNPPPAFTITYCGNSITARTFKSDLVQVIERLIENSIKHNSDQGKINVSVDARLDEYFIEITVSDDGVGVDKIHHERIFQPMKILQPRDNTTGTGVGLSIVKKIVEKRGGDINVESFARDGIAFRFSWPYFRSSTNG